MKELDTNTKTLYKYLAWTFGLAYLIQFFAAFMNYKLQQDNAGANMILVAAVQYLIAGMMFIPLISVMLAGGKIKEIGWKPRIKGCVPQFLFAWFVPAILTAIGAALYFGIFRSHFDLTGSYLVAVAGQEGLDTITSTGMTYGTYIIINCIACLTYAPLINMFPAVGEEAGWRGYMYPALREKFGQKKAWIIGGIIWGMWHWPLMIFTGYEYGKDYLGFPIVGMILFCAVTVALGILCDYVYQKSGCIWYPAIFHGAFNAAATIPLTVTLTGLDKFRILGAAPNGLIAGIPFFVLAAFIYAKCKKD